MGKKTLTHVCKITDNGSVRVTLADMPSYGISVKSKTLFCDLCGDYVTFAHGEKQTPSFRHEHDRDNPCPERTEANETSSNCYPLHFNKLGLPIKIVDSENSIRFEMGMLPLPDSVLEANAGLCAEIAGIFSPQNQSVAYFEISDYILSGEISYINIGSTPFEHYQINAQIKDPEEHWPKETSGFDGNGTLFDKHSKRMILPNESVEVGQEYYLVFKSFLPTYCRSIRCSLEKDLQKDWHIVSVKAESFTKEAARSFLSLHVRLNEKAPYIFPLWPPCVVKSDIIHYQGEGNIAFFMYGYNDFYVASYPRMGCKMYNRSQGYSLLDFYVSCDQQLVSIGYSEILQYLYLWKDKSGMIADFQDKKIDFSVTDESGMPLNEDIYFEVPKDNLVYIKAEYDGYVLLTQKGFVEYRVEFKSQDTVKIQDKIRFGEQLQIYIGHDCVQTITFLEKTQQPSNADTVLAKTLLTSAGRNVSMPHSLGAVMNVLPEYAQTRKVLYRFVRQGYMPAKALQILRKYICESLRENKK